MLQSIDHRSQMGGADVATPAPNVLGATVPNRDPARAALVRSRRQRRVFPDQTGRLLDLMVAVSALVFLAPAFVVIAVLVRSNDGGPAMFAHQRIGKNGRRFKVLKFRSMRIDAEIVLAEHLATNAQAATEWASDQKLRSDPRITPIGRFLRKSSLDELPQLLNVIRGDMSIVGPRPIVEAEISRYGRSFAAYCSVRPGITGIWQVSGRNDVSYRRRVAMDALYAKRKCVALDLKLMWATVPAVLSRRGSY